MAVRGPLHAIVLAAGEGTRMRSERPKPLHRLCGRPMVLHVLDALAELELDRVIVVVGHGAEWVTKTLAAEAPQGMGLEFVEQVVQRGTGDATQVALTGLPERRRRRRGDPARRHAAAAAAHPRPRWSPTPLERRRGHVVDRGRGEPHRLRPGGALGRRPGDPHRRRGRRDARGAEIYEVNTSITVFRQALLPPALRRLSPTNIQGEYYLTDVVEVLSDAGYSRQRDGRRRPDRDGRGQRPGPACRRRGRDPGSDQRRWMRARRDDVGPRADLRRHDVELSTDVALLAGRRAPGRLRRRPGGRDRPRHHAHRREVGEWSEIRYSMCERARIGAGAHVGPFAVLGPGAVVARR